MNSALQKIALKTFTRMLPGLEGLLNGEAGWARLVYPGVKETEQVTGWNYIRLRQASHKC